MLGQNTPKTSKKSVLHSHFSFKALLDTLSSLTLKIIQEGREVKVITGPKWESKGPERINDTPKVTSQLAVKTNTKPSSFLWSGNSTYNGCLCGLFSPYPC